MFLISKTFSSQSFYLILAFPSLRRVILFKNEGLHWKVPKKLFFFRKSCRKFGRSWLVIKAFHGMILISNLWLHLSWIINKAKVQRRLLNTSSFFYFGPQRWAILWRGKSPVPVAAPRVSEVETLFRFPENWSHVSLSELSPVKT
jgi:hypothetical protein